MSPCEDLRKFHKSWHATVIIISVYPNVGKSSTINALLGAKKVSVSATPGKTKHFQTIPLSSCVILCDSLGLVFPSFATTKVEMVCNGVLPIDQLREYTGPSRNLRPRKCDGTAKTSLPAASPAKPKAAPVKKSPAKSGPVKKATPKKATTKKKTVPKKTTTQPYKAVAPKDPPESEAARIERLKWKVWPPYIDVWEIPKCHQQHYADLFKTRGNPVPAWKRGCTQDHKDPVQARRLISWRAV